MSDFVFRREVFVSLLARWKSRAEEIMQPCFHKPVNILQRTHTSVLSSTQTSSQRLLCISPDQTTTCAVWKICEWITASQMLKKCDHLVRLENLKYWGKWQRRGAGCVGSALICFASQKLLFKARTFWDFGKCAPSTSQGVWDEKIDAMTGVAVDPLCFSNLFLARRDFPKCQSCFFKQRKIWRLC